MATKIRAGRQLLNEAINEFIKKRKKSSLTAKTPRGRKKIQPIKLEA